MQDVDPSDSYSSYVAECVHRWGGSSAISLIGKELETFTLPHIEGVIGYRVSYDCAVVFGDPVCEVEHLTTFASAFHDYCRKRGWTFIYITASHMFTELALLHGCKAALEIGEDLVLDPHHDFLLGGEGRRLRNKLHHAEHSHVKVDEYLGGNLAFEKELEEVAAKWLAGRKGWQIYLTDVDLFRERIGKRWFFAKEGDKVVGVLLLHKMQAGWLLQMLMAVPDAPIGTSEVLVKEVIDKLRGEGCHYFSFGTAQIGEIGEVIGLGSLSTWISRKLFKLANKLFHLDSKRVFWKKFQPNGQKSYLVFSRDKIRMKEIMSLMKAFHVSIW